MSADEVAKSVVGRQVGWFCVTHGGFKIGRDGCDAFMQLGGTKHDFYPVVIAERENDEQDPDRATREGWASSAASLGTGGIIGGQG